MKGGRVLVHEQQGAGVCLVVTSTNSMTDCRVSRVNLFTFCSKRALHFEHLIEYHRDTYIGYIYTRYQI